MVVSRRGSYNAVAAHGRLQAKAGAGRSFVRRNSNALLLGLAACLLLWWGWRPLQSSRAAVGRGGLGRRAGQQEVFDAAAAVNASAGLHGFVRKEGVADLHNWHPQYKAFRQERLQDWLAEREANLAQGAPPPPLPIYTGCQVWVNHLYRIVYLRHAKTASSSLFCHFGGCRGGADEPRDAALSFELLKADSPEALAALWRDYFVVTFVRNPYQRAVSSYRMMARQLAPGGGAAAALTWDRFCADPTGFAEQCMQDGSCQGRGRNFVYVHIQQQHDCLITEGGGWAVDFIGRVEHIDADLRLVLQELEQRRPPEAPPVKPLEGSLENVNGRGCNETATEGHSAAKEQYCDPVQYYQGRHAPCFQAVRHHYYSDAHSLRFGPDELPDV